jgi:signal transduction histidine kinase
LVQRPEQNQEQTPTRRGRGPRLVSSRGTASLAPSFLVLASIALVTALAFVAVPAGAEGWLAARGVAVSDRVGVLVVGGAGAALATLAGLTLRKRARVLHRVRSALLAFDGGERSMGALQIAPQNPVAMAWNRLLAWRGEEVHMAEASGLLAQSGETASEGGERFSDLLWHGLIIIDEQLVIRYANGAAGVFLRTKRDSLVGSDARLMIKDERVVAAVQSAVATGSRQKQVFDVGSVSDMESGVLRYSVRASSREGNQRVLVVIEDVTQQRVSEEVQHAFVAQAAHELRTPLTNIRLYIEQLIEEDLDAAERGSALNVLNQESSRLERIVADMLSIAEIQSGRMNVNTGDVRINQIYEELAADYAQAASHKRLTLTFDMPPKFPAIQGDREKISIVLHNLLGNAVKYTPAGGVVRVCVREQGDRLVTDVIDTGFGISEDDLGRIFERFARGRDSRVEAEPGTGLGLALARDIARLHGGDITARSELDAGSTFSFWLPVASATSAKAA